MPASTSSTGRCSSNVQQACERFNVPLDARVARLKAAGIEASATTMIRELATARGKTPIDIAKIVVGEDGTVPSASEHKPGVGLEPARAEPRRGADR